MSRAVGWKVYIGRIHVDTIFFTPDCDANYVYNSLVEHDGYPPNIRVEKQS